MPKLNPGRRARLDQVLAAAKQQAITDHAIVTVVATHDGNSVCSWCDCPITDHAPGYVPPTCTGCHLPADKAVHEYHPGGIYRGNITICEHHMDDFIAVYHQVGRTNPEVVLYDPKPWKAKR